MKILLLIFFSSLLLKTNGQADASLQALRIGDKVPDISLGEIINTDLKEARISDFRGKLLILDFWNVSCATCIIQFPRLAELQKKFDKQIMILPVGFDARQEGSIRSFVEKRKGTQYELKLPSAVRKAKDTVLMALFPFIGLPHEIWIDPNGIFIGATSHIAVTAENIQNILAGQKLNFTGYIIKKGFDYNNTFLINEGLFDNRPVYGSAFGGYIDSVRSSTLIRSQSNGSRTRLIAVNQTMLFFYRNAYGRQYPFLISEAKNKSIIMDSATHMAYKDWVDVKDADNWAMDEFQQNHLHSYELIIPGNSVDEAFQKIINDLDSYFRLKSKIEKRKLAYLSLTRTSKSDKLRASGDSQNSYYSPDQLIVKMRGIEVSGLIDYLDDRIEKYPVLDETNYKHKIDIDIELRKNFTLQDINDALKKYDLRLELKEKTMDILCLSMK